MNEMPVIALGIGVMLLAYVLHGGWLAHRWGVDPSRKTPACQGAAVHRRARSAKSAALSCVTASLWPAMTAYICVEDVFGMTVGLAVFALCAVLCGGLSFAVLFVCVRTDKDLAQVAGEELFPDAKPIVYALTALTMIGSVGLMVELMLTGLEFVLWYCVVLWLMLGVTSASQCEASAIRSERHMQVSAYGGAVCAGVLAIVCLEAMLAQQIGSGSTLPLLIPVLMLLTALVSIGRGADALRRMMQSPLQRKEKVPPFVWTLLCAAASIALGLVAKEWMVVLSCAAGTVCLLLAVTTCARWFHRIGRGLFSGN